MDRCSTPLCVPGAAGGVWQVTDSGLESSMPGPLPVQKSPEEPLFGGEQVQNYWFGQTGQHVRLSIPVSQCDGVWGCQGGPASLDLVVGGLVVCPQV